MGPLEAIVLTLALSAGNDTVLLDFYGDSCPPCRKMMPVVEQLAARGYPVRKVDVGREPALANQFRGWTVRVSVKSVNHRFLDIKLRMPDSLEPFEHRLRQAVRGRIHRGHLDVHVSAAALQHAIGANGSR